MSREMEKQAHSFNPYVVRPVEFIDQVESDGWCLQVYAISTTSLPLPNEIVSAGLKQVLPHLSQPALTENRYSVGFLVACVHELRVVNYESEAWIKTVLCDNVKSSFEDYLQLRLRSDYNDPA